MAIDSPSPSPSLATLSPGASPPALRTVSLAKNVWDQETAYLHSREATQSVHGPLGGDESTVSLGIGGGGGGSRPALPAYRSVFGLPMLSCCKPAYRAWSIVILLLDLSYSAFLLPISIGMQVNDLEITWACIVDLVAGAFFAAELVLGFHVGFVATSAGKKREILDGRHVAAYYMRRGTFVQDLLSTLIWIAQIVLLSMTQSGVSMPHTMNAFQIVRIVRIVRFVSILRSIFSMTISSGNSSILPGLRFSASVTHIFNILYAGLVLVNFFGCLFNFMAIKEGFENTWMNPVGQLVRAYSADGMSILTPEELAAVPGPRRWLTGFYFTLTTVATLGYGDITPSTAAETAVDCFLISFGVLMFGIIMGSIAEQVANSSREARQAQLYREKMQVVRAWIRGSSMPKALKAKINAFYSEVWVKHASAADATQLFFELPHQLRQEIAWEMNKEAFAQLPFFAYVDETMRYVLSSFMAPLDLTPGQELALRGDLADRFWILHEGEVQVVGQDCDVLRVVQAPAVLGESALLQQSDNKYCVRPHGYRTATGCSLWEVHLRDLMPFLLAHPEVLEAMTRTARCRLTRESMLSVAALSEGGLTGDSNGAAGRSKASRRWGWDGGASSDGGVQAGGGEVFPAPAPGAGGETGGQDGSEGGSPGPGQEHTTLEFAADSLPPLSAEGASSFPAGRCSIQLVVDARGGPVAGAAASLQQCGPWPEEAEAEEAAGREEEEEQQRAAASAWEPGAEQAGDAPITRGELQAAIEGLRGDLAGRLEELALDVRRALRASNTHAAMPLWAARSPDRCRTARQLSLVDRRGTRDHSPSPSPSSHSGMRWSFGQFS